jgi:hypothetical protein
MANNLTNIADNAIFHAFPKQKGKTLVNKHLLE